MARRKRKGKARHRAAKKVRAEGTHSRVKKLFQAVAEKAVVAIAGKLLVWVIERL